MKKTASLLLTAMVLLSTALPVQGAAALTAAQAKAIAEKYVPKDSVHMKTKSDDGRYEVTFYSTSYEERYEVDVSKLTQKLAAFESKRFDHSGSQTATLTEAQAKKAVTNEIPAAEILSVVLDRDDGLREYDVRFKTGSLYGEYTIHPTSGKVLERDIRFGVQPTTTDTSKLISYERATALALAKVPGGVVTDVDIDREGGVYFYEVEVYKDGIEYELGFNATTGALLWSSSHRDDDWYKYQQPTQGGASQGSAIQGSASQGGFIGIEKAKQIALAKVPGATVRKCKLDYDDGFAVYEGELYHNGWEYDFEIDARTGTILDWDADFDD